MDSQAFLRAFGRHLRELRERQGLTLSELARRAGLSRRHLTEAEAGRANPSLSALSAVAHGLALPLRTLCDLELTDTERVALVGLRGAGKSTVGARLALLLEVPFVELDRVVEEQAGLSLAEIFDLHGAAAFRRYEADALERVLARGERLVIATGGSLVTRPATFERLRRTCRTVWLKAEPAEHFQRVLEQGDRRPMQERPRAMAELEAILAEREPLYAQCELALDTSGRAPDDLARASAARLAR
jgi:XRE family aerobic/anaerobic benzoate catabolism transcriptional regulator